MGRADPEAVVGRLLSVQQLVTLAGSVSSTASISATRRLSHRCQNAAIDSPTGASRGIFSKTSRSVRSDGLLPVVETGRLKCFEMLPEGFVHIGERVENGSEPRP